MRIAYMEPDRRRERGHEGITHYITDRIGIGVTIQVSRHEDGTYTALVVPPIGRCFEIRATNGGRWQRFRLGLEAARSWAMMVYPDRIHA